MAALIAWRRWSLGTSTQNQNFPHQLSDFPRTLQGRDPKQISTLKTSAHTEQALGESVLEVNGRNQGLLPASLPSSISCLWKR